MARPSPADRRRARRGGTVVCRPASRVGADSGRCSVGRIGSRCPIAARTAGSQEHLERHERRHRVARQGDDRRSRLPPAPTRPAPCGMPGCMRTLANSTPWPVRASLTTSYAPAETPPEVTIRSTSVAASASRDRNAVTSSSTRWAVIGFGTDLGQCRGQHGRVGLVDLPRPQRQSRRDELCTGGQQQHSNRPVHRQGGEAERSGDPDLRRADHPAGRQHDGALTDVFAPPPQMDPRRWGVVDPHRLRATIGALDRDDHLRAVWNRRAGHDPGRRAPPAAAGCRSGRPGCPVKPAATPAAGRHRRP